MYGDDYKPQDPERYREMEEFFDKAESRADLAERTVMMVFDRRIFRVDIHVAHKRACLKKGWEWSAGLNGSNERKGNAR